MNTPKIVACPHCHKPTPWTPESKWKPFCSKRCRLMDLGEWFSEGYRIGSDEQSSDHSEDDEHE